MTRSAYFITNGFPFLMRYWMELFKNWEDEIDMVYIAFDRELVEPSLEPYIRKILTHPKIQVMEKHSVQFKGLTDMVKNGKEDGVLLLHDDTFILKEGVIDRYFTLVEQGKVVTPLYKHYAPPWYVEKLMKQAFGDKVPLKVAGTTEEEYSFLLYFFFCSRQLLNKTSFVFEGQNFDAGTYLKPLNTTVDRNMGGDTGFLLGLELLATGADFHPISCKDNTTYFLTSLDNPIEFLQAQKNSQSGLYDRNTDWIHIMAMANQFKNWFWTLESEEKEPRYMALSHFKGNTVINEGMMIRLGWLAEFIQMFDFKEIGSYLRYINKTTEDMIDYFGLSRDKIQTYKHLFHQMVWK